MCPSCSIATLVVAGLICLLAALILFLLAKTAIDNTIENKIRIRLSKWDVNSLNGLHNRILALEQERVKK